MARYGINIFIPPIFYIYKAPATHKVDPIVKAKTAEKRLERQTQAKLLYEQLEKEPQWQSLPQERQQERHRTATGYAQVFQRSSSNVEGRNGHLSLHHHIYKAMNKRKLKAATVMHNYFIKRPDGTTAAERFFGNAPESLFGHLLSVTDYPAAPAKVRSNVRKLATAA